jgi:addiction module RelE/StbE family toxin
MEYSIEISDRARRDLREIRSYLDHSGSGSAAEICEYLLQQALSLRIFPDRNSTTHNRSVRRLVAGAYLVVYRVNKSSRSVEILRFWHGARDPRTLRMRESLAVYATAAQDS